MPEQDSEQTEKSKYTIEPSKEMVERNPEKLTTSVLTKPTNKKEMSFLDHLEELRWHLIRAVAAILIFSILAFAFPSIVFNSIILGPATSDFITFKLLCQLSELVQSSALCIDQMPFTIQSRKMTGQFSMHILSSIVIGLICAFPYAFWEIWTFVKPGLHENEYKVSRGATFFVTLLFLMGVSFGYFIVSPLAVNFLANYQIDAAILNEFDITSYVATLAMIVLASGVMFQLPMVVYFLSKVGLVTPTLMRRYRRHAIVVILIVAAIITPPDPITQIFVAFPVIILYQFSMVISASVQKSMAKTRKKFMEK